MANEIDILMDLDPLELAALDGGIEGIIAIMRQRRALSEAGIKPKKETGPKVKLSLEALGITVAPAAPVKRRF